MSIMLSEAAHCEHQSAYGYESNHVMGNQGDELRTIAYYNLPWQYCFRCTDEAIAKRIAVRQLVAVNNKRNGYGQPQRNTFWEQLTKHNYDPAQNDTCDTDCSMLSNSSVECAFMEAGKTTKVSHNMVTAQMPAAYLSDPMFQDVSASINWNTGAGLRVGDVLVTPGKHTAVVTSADAGPSTTPKWVGEVTGCQTCEVWADANKSARCSGYPTLGVTNLVDVCDEAGGFYYVRITAKYYGYVEKCYLKNHATSVVRQGKTTTDLYMRTAPKTGKAIKVIPANTVVTINSEQDGWYNVTYSGCTGWSSAKYIKE